MQRHGGELLPVFLHCSREEAMRRVGNPDRVERRKMTSGEAFQTISTTTNSPRCRAPTASRWIPALPRRKGRAENRRSFRARRLRPDIRSHYPRHCERSEAIHSRRLWHDGLLRCARNDDASPMPPGVGAGQIVPSASRRVRATFARVGNHACVASDLRCAPMPRTTLEETARGTWQTLSACGPEDDGHLDIFVESSRERDHSVEREPAELGIANAGKSERRHRSAFPRPASRSSSSAIIQNHVRGRGGPGLLKTGVGLPKSRTRAAAAD